MDESEAARNNEENSCIAVLQTLSEEQRDRNRDMQEVKESKRHNQNDKLAKRHPLLKYAYKDEQWSPLNLSGKRVYDRDFLIELWNDPNSYVKPSNLPDVSIVLKHNSAQLKNRNLKIMKSLNDVKQCENEEPDQSDSTPKGPLLYEYTHEPDQRSPLSMSGKKVYDREFLINLRNDPNSNIRPLKLPDLDVVLEENYRGRHDSLLLPGFVKSSQNARGRAKRVSQQGKPKGNKLVVIRDPYSIEEDVKLRKSDNPWKPSRLKSDTASKDSNPTDDLYKTVRRILNKMMPEKCDKLLDQVKALRIESKEELEGVAQLIFDKAINEPRFSALYALMCKELATMQISSPEDQASEQNSDLNLRKLIITRCVMEFEEAVDKQAGFITKQEIEGIANPDGEPLQALTEQERINRTRSFGNIRFIGELVKQKLLTTFIMHRCLRHLLKQIDDESLECLCQLLITVGKSLESKNQKLDPYFEQMLDIVNGKVPGKVSPRVRFMLQDVIELRTWNWIPRKRCSDLKMLDKIKIDAGSKGSALLARNHLQYSVGTSRLENKPPSMDNLQLGAKNTSQKSGNAFADPPESVTPSEFGTPENTSSEQDKYSALPLSGDNGHPDYKSESSYDSILRVSIPPSQSTPMPKGPTSPLSEEQLAVILEEYLSDTSMSTAALEACETFDNSAKAIFVREVLNRVVDRSATARKEVSQLMTTLISKNILPMYLYNFSLAEVLDTAADLEIDIPKIWVYLAELIWYPLAEGAVLCSELKTAMAPLQNKGLAEKLMKELMIISVREKGPELIKDTWDQASLKWSDFSQEGATLDDNIKKHPSVDIRLSGDKNVSRHVSADVPKTVKLKKSSALENTSSKQDKSSVLSIPGSSASGSKDHGSPVREVSCPPVSTVSKSPSSTSKKGLAKKSTIILDNYLADARIDTAAEKVRETFDDSTYANFVREALSKVVNKSQAARKQVSQLMTHLISNNILQSSLYLSSLGEVLDASGDVVIDVSKIWASLAELIWYPLAEGVVPFSELKTTLAPLKNKGLAGTLLGELMIVLVREKSPEWTKDKWNQSGLKLRDFLQENESLNDFIKKYKLEFMLRDSTGSHGSSSGLSLNMEQIHEQLLCLMSDEEKNSLNNICTWISANVGERTSEPEFIKALMTTILEVSIDSFYNTWQFRVDRFQNLQALIPRYIDDDIKVSELQCLIAIQEYIHQLDGSQRVLLEILEKQIFESILSFDVFHVWESNKDPKPLNRKTIAMMAVKSFFTSLKGTNGQSSLNKT